MTNQKNTNKLKKGEGEHYKKIIKAIVCLLLLCVLTLCSVISATAVIYHDAWMNNRFVSPSVPTSNFTPTVYNSIEANTDLGDDTVKFLSKLQASIEMLGFNISHWEGFVGSTAGVSGRLNYEWQSGVSSGKDTYWVLMSYTVMISMNSQPYQTSVYIRDPEYQMEEVDSFTGTLALGVATVNATGTVYRVTNNPVTTGGAFSSYLQVNYRSGSYASDGMQFPVIVPQWYEEQTDAEKALDDIKQGIDDLNEGLFGDYSDSELDGITSAVGDLDDTAESIGGALDVSDFDVVNPDIADGTEGLPVLFSIYNILFENSWLVYIVSLALGMYVLKLILYGKAQ